MKKSCLQCNKTFEAKKEGAKYCSNGCRTKAHRKRNGIAEPSFLGSIGKDKTDKQINPLYLNLKATLEANEKHYQTLEAEKMKIVSQLGTINESVLKHTLIGTGTGAGIGVAYSEILFEELSPVAKGAITVLASGLFTKLGNVQGKARAEKKSNELSAKLNQINIEQNSVLLIIEHQKKELKNIPQYLKTEEKTSDNQNCPPIINLSNIGDPPEKNTVTAKEVSEMYFPTWKLEGEFGNLLGELSNPFYMMVYGSPGAGKSTFSFQFTNYLSQTKGKVLLIPTEEGISKTLQKKILDHKADSPNLHVLKATGAIKEQDLSGYPFIVIDSVNDANLSPKDLKDLKNKYPKTSFIFILQSNKDGTFKGGNEYLHDVDISIKLDNGVATTEKNRMKPKGETYIVFK